MVTSPVRIVAPTAAFVAVGSAVAAAVNLATEWKTSWWAWLAVVALTVISGGVSLWLYRRQAHANSSLGAGGVSVGIGTLNYYVAAASAAATDTTSRDVPSPQPALPTSVSGRRDHRRRRLQQVLAIAVAGVAYPTYLLLSPPARGGQENADRPTSSAMSAGHDAHADFYRQDRQFKLYDDRRDGRSAILQVKINGTLLPPWYNSGGRTDAMHPPAVKPLGFDPYATVEYRVCVGKGKDRDKPLDEKSCGPWVIDRTG